MPLPEADRQSGEVAFGQRLIAANEKRNALCRKLFGELPHPGGVARKLEEELPVPPGSVVSPPDVDADDEIGIPRSRPTTARLASSSGRMGRK